MVPDLEVTVLGCRPAPQGSKKHVGNGRMIEVSKRVKPWRQAVEEAVLSSKPVATLGGPLKIEVVFTVRKPASAPKRIWPTTRDSGDIDKLLRSTFDALTNARAIEDDSCIVDVVTRKVHPGYGTDALSEPGAVIRVWRIDH